MAGAISGEINPHGSDICGLCLHRHNRSDCNEAT
jgi:hypothetical protein